MNWKAGGGTYSIGGVKYGGIVIGMPTSILPIGYPQPVNFGVGRMVSEGLNFNEKSLISKMHQKCTKSAPTVHQQCIENASKMHQTVIKIISQTCIISASNMDQPFTHYDHFLIQTCTNTCIIPAQYVFHRFTCDTSFDNSFGCEYYSSCTCCLCS